ncbi:hypothetical protein LI328DRAFT_139866 [Trichoderma asperelloides]|nr:hypothetical protein LI328DRAFT_139866 [Trichoderma asperelloides]
MQFRWRSHTAVPLSSSKHFFAKSNLRPSGLVSLFWSGVAGLGLKLRRPTIIHPLAGCLFPFIVAVHDLEQKCIGICRPSFSADHITPMMKHPSHT